MTMVRWSVNPYPVEETVVIDVERVMATHDVASVRLRVQVGDLDRLFEGSSKRDPHDSSDQDLGMEIALGRALSSAGHYLQKHSAGLIKHNDDVKADKARRKTEAKKTKKKTAK